MTGSNTEQTTTPPTENTLCHVCGKAPIECARGYGRLRRVTSDCRPWPSGGGIGVCPACGFTQKAVNSAWRAEAGEIYAHYVMYAQSGGIEPAVFAAAGNAMKRRSEGLVEHVAAQITLPASGRLLDIGCGNGALLRAFAAAVPGWSLAGSELHDSFRESVISIPGVEDLYTCPFDDIPGAFDCITMVHALEHIENPAAFLLRLREKLLPGGFLIIESPDSFRNYFDFLIADHATHFSPHTVRALFEHSGFEIVALHRDWIPKELSVIGRNSPGSPASPGFSPAPPGLPELEHGVAWLRDITVAAGQHASENPIGVFGTAIAASWLSEVLGRAASFFVDEDPLRAGKTYLDRPVHLPKDVPPGSTVYIPLPESQSRPIREKLARSFSHFRCIIPPPGHET